MKIIAFIFNLLILNINVFGQQKNKYNNLKNSTIINTAIIKHYYKQKKNLHYNVELQGITTKKNVVPYGMRANQYGSVPLSGTSIASLGGISKSYDTTTNFFNYGFSLLGRINIGYKTQFALIEGYAKIRLSIFELRGGRTREIIGLVDSTLSSGAFAVSGNALGIPKIQFSIPEYFTLPLTFQLLSVKGSFSHGWLGKYEVFFPGNKSVITYFHQKTLYGRLGRPNWRLHILGGFNHQVFWGNEGTVYGSRWTPSLLDTYKNVVLGNTTRLKNVEKSKVGNALGSIDFGIQYEFRRFRILAYRQFFYDVGALYYLANAKDGLTGLSITNTNKKNKKIRINKFLTEYFYSVDQAGYPWSKTTPSGDEDYYNNYYYIQGWSYQDAGVGNPLITPRNLARKDFPVSNSDYFVNNRVSAIHIGVDINIRGYNLLAKGTASNNLGTYSTSPFGSSLEKKFNKPVGKFKESNQYSVYVEGKKPIKNNFYIGSAVAFDFGDLLYNSSGFLIKAGWGL